MDGDIEHKRGGGGGGASVIGYKKQNMTDSFCGFLT